MEPLAFCLIVSFKSGFHEVILTPLIFALPNIEIKLGFLSLLFVIFNHDVSLLLIVRLACGLTIILALRIHTPLGSFSKIFLLFTILYIWDKLVLQVIVILFVLESYLAQFAITAEEPLLYLGVSNAIGIIILSI